MCAGKAGAVFQTVLHGISNPTESVASVKSKTRKVLYVTVLGRVFAVVGPFIHQDFAFKCNFNFATLTTSKSGPGTAVHGDRFLDGSKMSY